jgi:uncharacterized protein with PQ loop repeat
MLITTVSFLPHITNTKNVESFDGIYNRLGGFQLFLMVVLLLLGFVTMISACIVAYNCNKRENISIKMFIVIFVFFFSEFYIPYYLIKYAILGRKCNNNVIVRSNNNVRRNNVRKNNVRR